nr:MAG TPA: hypothetical protein [Caudoviricetes sp.]
MIRQKPGALRLGLLNMSHILSICRKVAHKCRINAHKCSTKIF